MLENRCAVLDIPVWDVMVLTRVVGRGGGIATNLSKSADVGKKRSLAITHRRRFVHDSHHRSCLECSLKF